MGGLGVVVLVVTLGALAAVMGRPVVGRRLRPRGRRRALPSWIREAPLPPGHDLVMHDRKGHAQEAAKPEEEKKKA